MARNLIIVIGGLAFGLIVGVLAPSIDFGVTSDNFETASNENEASSSAVTITEN